MRPFVRGHNLACTARDDSDDTDHRCTRPERRGYSDRAGGSGEPLAARHTLMPLSTGFHVVSRSFPIALVAAAAVVAAGVPAAHVTRTTASPIVQAATPVADTYAERYGMGGAGNVIHGAEDTLLTGYFDGGGEALTVYVRFGVNPFARDHEIDAATVGMYARRVNGWPPDTDLVTATLHAVEEDWDESTLVGENMPPLGPQIGPAVEVRKGQWSFWDVTDETRRWEAGEPNHGLAVVAHPYHPAALWSASFDSREAPMAPKLLIERMGGGKLMLPALAARPTAHLLTIEPAGAVSPRTKRCSRCRSAHEGTD